MEVTLGLESFDVCGLLSSEDNPGEEQLMFGVLGETYLSEHGFRQGVPYKYAHTHCVSFIDI